MVGIVTVGALVASPTILNLLGFSSSGQYQMTFTEHSDLESQLDNSTYYFYITYLQYNSSYLDQNPPELLGILYERYSQPQTTSLPFSAVATEVFPEIDPESNIIPWTVMLPHVFANDDGTFWDYEDKAFTHGWSSQVITRAISQNFVGYEINMFQDLLLNAIEETKTLGNTSLTQEQGASILEVQIGYDEQPDLTFKAYADGTYALFEANHPGNVWEEGAQFNLVYSGQLGTAFDPFHTAINEYLQSHVTPNY